MEITRYQDDDGKRHYVSNGSDEKQAVYRKLYTNEARSYYYTWK